MEKAEEINDNTPLKRYRFYLPDTQEVLYPKRCEVITYGADTEPIYNLSFENESDNRILKFSEVEFYPELATGLMAINGEIYQDDIVRYKGRNYRVSYNKITDSFSLVFSSSDSVNFSDLPRYASNSIEIIGTIFSDIISEDESTASVNNSTTSDKDDNNDSSLQDIQQFESDSLEEDFLWDDEVSDLIEMSFSARPTDKCDIFIKSVLDRKSSNGAWAFYFSSKTRFVSSNKESTSNKKELEMLCLKNALSELDSPHLVKLHLDNGFLKKLLLDKIETSLGPLTALSNDVKKIASKHQISFELENRDNPIVEGVIAYDAARKVL